jgi:hypothetical protein
MPARTDKGCGTPQDAERKKVHERLVNLFAPIVYFDPLERFFPVDLPATIQHSSLWRADPDATPPSTQREKDVGQIQPSSDLPNATQHHYTTVAGTGSVLKTVDGSTFSQPIPLLDQAYKAYRDTIQAELAIYGTVCKASEVPNSHFFKESTPNDHQVAHAIGEGLIVSYYMYFPACESSELNSEGDWAGISLLLKETPTTLQQLNDPQQIGKFLPVLACYYRKTASGAPPAPHFVAGVHGFRSWSKVRRGKDQSVGLDTHPIVYVSQGRHNCYYEPGVVNIPILSTWAAKADGIEGGTYTPGPVDNTIEGSVDWEDLWWAYILFPPLLLVAACATGCHFPVEFDSTVSFRCPDVQDQTRDDGFNGLPGAKGSSYPQTPAGQVPASARQVSMRLHYVDLDDSQTAGIWGYPGAWGGATRLTYKYFINDEPINGDWGYYQGARRPALGAWFLWNLFIDDVFGCDGEPSVTPTPV